MNIKKLASIIAKKEGKKSQVKIGDVREVLGIVSDLIYDDINIAMVIYENGQNRAKRKKK